MLTPRVRSRLETDWGYIKSIALLLIYGILEELLEEAIALGISALVAKAISLIVMVIFTGIIKVSTTSVIKGVIVLLKPVVKKMTYKKGNDKTQKLVTFFRSIFKMDKKDTKKVDIKNFFVRLFAYLKRNVKTNTATITNLISSLGAGALTTGGFIVGKVQIPEWSVYVIGVIVTVVMFVITQLGVKGKGTESQDEYDTRRQAEAEAKKAKQAEKAKAKAEKQEMEEIKRQLAEEAEAEAKAREEAEAEIRNNELELERKQEEEKKVAERNNKIAEIKAEYQKAVADGSFSGSLVDYLNRK